MSGERTLEDVTAEVREEARTDASLAQAIGFWMLREWPDGLGRALSRLQFQNTSPLTDDERREAGRVADRLHHEMNRQSSNYQYRQKRIAPLKKLHLELWERKQQAGGQPSGASDMEEQQDELHD